MELTASSFNGCHAVVLTTTVGAATASRSDSCAEVVLVVVVGSFDRCCTTVAVGTAAVTVGAAAVAVISVATLRVCMRLFLLENPG